jgi:hypothetical protein
MGGGGHGGWKDEEEEETKVPPVGPLLYLELAARWKAGDTGLCAGQPVIVRSDRAQRRASGCMGQCSPGLYRTPIHRRIPV